jgi:DNA-binding transcriptional LysR family regulator
MNSASDIAVFVRVVELGSFTKAADALEISKAAVSKYVNRLEQRLDARLSPDDAPPHADRGRPGALWPELRRPRGTGRSRKRRRAAHGQAPRHAAGVGADLFRQHHARPAHQGIRARYPEITLDLDLSDRIVDLVKERFDVAVRISAMHDSSLVATRLAPCPTALVGSPAYFRRHGTPKTPADLASHEGLGYSIIRTPNEWRFRAAKGRWVTVTVRSTIRCNNDFALKQFALDGLGLAFFPRFFVEGELAGGKLARLEDYPGPDLSINAVYETRRHLLPKVRSFLNFLTERFGPRS